MVKRKEIDMVEQKKKQWTHHAYSLYCFVMSKRSLGSSMKIDINIKVYNKHEKKNILKYTDKPVNI